jgi:hypothetical protein
LGRHGTMWRYPKPEYRHIDEKLASKSLLSNTITVKVVGNQVYDNYCLKKGIIYD